MSTLNEYASRIVGILGRQADHAMRERVKAAFKSVFATRIRQSISKNGIDELLVITCKLNLDRDTDTAVEGFDVFKTTSKVPSTIRFANDSLHTRVRSNLPNDIPFSARTLVEILLADRSDSKGFNRYYTLDSGILRLFIKTTYKNLTFDTSSINTVYVDSIYENPEEVIAIWTREDASDIELPFPADMLESVVQEVLKIEFGYVAPEVEVKS
jgi:hypothetical protein